MIRSPAPVSQRSNDSVPQSASNVLRVEAEELLKLAQSVQQQLAEDLVNTHSETAISTARALNKVTSELEQALLRATKRRRIIKVVK
jgi:hypothetical protein